MGVIINFSKRMDVARTFTSHSIPQSNEVVTFHSSEPFVPTTFSNYTTTTNFFGAIMKNLIDFRYISVTSLIFSLIVFIFLFSQLIIRCVVIVKNRRVRGNITARLEEFCNFIRI